MTGLLLAVLATSLLGSLHCLGMCGGFVALVASGGRPGCASLAGAGALAQSAYHLGRATTYIGLGALAGGLGAGLDRVAGLAGLQRAAAVAAGAVLLAGGLLALLAAAGVAARLPRLEGLPVARWLAAAARAGRARPLLLGLLTPLLPCGWLWLFVASAAGAGGPLRGAAVMAAFWLGTVPALLGLGLGLARLAAPLRARLPWLQGAALVAVGVVVLAGRGAAPIPLPAAPREATAAAVDSARSAPLPCCRREGVER